MFTAQASPDQAADDVAVQTEEPPDEQIRRIAGPPLNASFVKSVPVRASIDRRESLLTRQLHASESESHDEDLPLRTSAGRALSTSSAAELTSDNDLTSPGTRCSTPSPPLPPTRINLPITPLEKIAPREPVILEQDEPQKVVDQAEKAVETGLGRRRCITFACGGKPKDTKEPIKSEQKTTTSPPLAEPAKRKCAITFACPMRTKQETPKKSPIATRHISPAPRHARSPRDVGEKVHRNSDATVTSVSPVSLRKVPSVIKRRRAKYADAIDEETREAKRFHEFASNAKADDEWTEVTTVHRNRLTVRDTLQKENLIRQMGQEVEDEVAEDEAELDDEAILDELDVEEDIDNDDNDEEDDNEEDGVADDDDDKTNVVSVMAQAGDNVSDRGFSTDDEQGFALSSEGEEEDSDYEWWAPGRSTAATSTDHIEMIRPINRRKMSDSSLESAREANGNILRRHKKSKARSAAVDIDRPPTPELPDSTDFVCGTLDEDRPLEQAYMICLKQRKDAKHHVTPQDIDPTFPTSDPEMDEEDEVDEGDLDADDDDAPLFLHGKMEINDEKARRGREKSSNKKRSPHPSPRRLRSPPPPHHRAIHRSPPPPNARRTSLRSPPPPAHRNRCRSPPPRKLFGASPPRLRSPPSGDRLTSPPNSCASSIEGTPVPQIQPRTPGGLGSRPALTKTASLPRVPTMTKINQLAVNLDEDDEEDGEKEQPSQDRRHRGAIDIVKGLEKKRQRRKEKLYQKQCQKAKKEGEKRCKPGKGAERMRELGLELAAYRGKTAEHILSI